MYGYAKGVAGNQMTNTDYILRYGKSSLKLSIPSEYTQSLIEPADVAGTHDPLRVVENALDRPLNYVWRPIERNERIAITINDKTRPVPNHLLLPPLLDRLKALGASDHQIEIWIASGSHKPMPVDEFHLVLPVEIARRYRVTSHDIDQTENLIEIGRTTRGTPVIVNKAFYSADLKIVVGDIEPHHFAGFSGGYKSAAIGLAGRPTINHNHAMLTSNDATIGRFLTNPLRQDIEEIGRTMGVHLSLNAVLNNDRQIVAAFFGMPAEVIQAGMQVSKQVCGVPVSHPFDIVVASAGGYPKDINFYQAQKAITHASLFCKKNGSILLLAECIEGTGSLAYEQFMTGKRTSEEVMKAFAQQEFRVGPHKAFQVARLLQSYQIAICSAMDASLVSGLLMQPANSPQIVLDEFLRSHLASTGTAPSIAILPHATTTITFH